MRHRGDFGLTEAQLMAEETLEPKPKRKQGGKADSLLMITVTR